MQATDLTLDSVSILTEVEGHNHQKAYINNVAGRAELITDVPPAIVVAIMAVWGAVPTEPEETE